MTRKRIIRIVLTGAVVIVGAGLLVPSDAEAQCFSYHSGYGGISFSYGSHYGGHHGYHRAYRVPIYHPPSVHLDRVYHHDYSHWTPRRGWHSHGHYDVVPHYVPGHFDTLHGRHIDLNPRYHH